MSRLLWIIVLAAAILFLSFCFLDYASGDAKVLPVGTRITLPDGGFYVIAEEEFLLQRTDMEAATYALAVLPINEKLISDLRSLSNKQARDKVFIGAASLIGGLVVGVASGVAAGYLAK
jgi:uncharacterized membrane protein YedE/YeeE